MMGNKSKIHPIKTILLVILTITLPFGLYWTGYSLANLYREQNYAFWVQEQQKKVTSVPLAISLSKAEETVKAIKAVFGITEDGVITYKRVNNNHSIREYNKAIQKKLPEVKKVTGREAQVNTKGFPNSELTENADKYITDKARVTEAVERVDEYYDFETPLGTFRYLNEATNQELTQSLDKIAREEYAEASATARRALEGSLPQLNENKQLQNALSGSGTFEALYRTAKIDVVDALNPDVPLETYVLSDATRESFGKLPRKMGDWDIVKPGGVENTSLLNHGDDVTELIPADVREKLFRKPDSIKLDSESYIRLDKQDRELLDEKYWKLHLDTGETVFARPLTDIAAYRVPYSLKSGGLEDTAVKGAVKFDEDMRRFERSFETMGLFGAYEKRSGEFLKHYIEGRDTDTIKSQINTALSNNNIGGGIKGQLRKHAGNPEILPGGIGVGATMGYALGTTSDWLDQTEAAAAAGAITAHLAGVPAATAALTALATGPLGVAAFGLAAIPAWASAGYSAYQDLKPGGDKFLFELPGDAAKLSGSILDYFTGGQNNLDENALFPTGIPGMFNFNPDALTMFDPNHIKINDSDIVQESHDIGMEPNETEIDDNLIIDDSLPAEAQGFWDDYWKDHEKDRRDLERDKRNELIKNVGDDPNNQDEDQIITDDRDTWKVDRSGNTNQETSFWNKYEKDNPNTPEMRNWSNNDWEDYDWHGNIRFSDHFFEGNGTSGSPFSGWSNEMIRNVFYYDKESEEIKMYDDWQERLKEAGSNQDSNIVLPGGKKKMKPFEPEIEKDLEEKVDKTTEKERGGKTKEETIKERMKKIRKKANKTEVTNDSTVYIKDGKQITAEKGKKLNGGDKGNVINTRLGVKKPNQ